MSSTFARPPRDETLSARLDDELPPGQLDAVDAWLHANPASAERLAGWRADRDALRGRFDAVLDEPVPQAMTRLVWHGSATKRPAWQALAAGIALFVVGTSMGLGIGFGVGHQRGAEAGPPARSTGAEPASPASPTQAAFVQRAVLAHSVYVPEVRHPVEVRAQEEHLARWLTKRIDVPVKLFDLRAQGWELIGGRLLPDGAGPSAQLMYQRIGATAAPSAAPGADQRVTVYLRRDATDVPATFRYEQQGELGMFYWVEGQAGYALVGQLPRSELLALAQAIEGQQPR